MVEVEVFAGPCRFITVIRVEGMPNYQAKCQIESDCPNFKKIAKSLESETLNVMNESFKKGKSHVIKLCQDNIPHVSCPVPVAILKALEVATGLGLPKDATITFVDKDFI